MLILLTSDALNKSIKSLRGEENKNISLVFGCGEIEISKTTLDGKNS